MAACVPCGRSYSKKYSLKRHLAAHHGDPQHQCSECHNIYARRDVLERHLKQCHSTIELQAEATESEGEDQEQSDVLAPGSTGASSENMLAVTASLISRDPSEQALSIGLLPDSWFTTTTVVPYDRFGQVDAKMWTNEQHEDPPCPPFLIDVVQRLRYHFQNAVIESIMYLCVLHPATGKPIPPPANPALTSNPAFRLEYVPCIRCLDCSDERLFAVSPFDGIKAVIDHLSVPHHWVARRNIELAAECASRDSSSWPAYADFVNDIAALTDQTLLIVAVKKHGLGLVRQLLREGFSVNGKDSEDRSALHWACCLNQLDVAEALVSHGASLGDVDCHGQTPLDIIMDVCGVNGAVNLIHILSRYEQNRSAVTFDSALALACRFNRLPVIERLLLDGADVNAPTINAPLALAIRHASWEVVQLLLSKGADLQGIRSVHLHDLVRKRDGQDLGTSYPDAAEKIAVLKCYELDVDAKPTVSLHPWWYVQ